MSSPSLDGLDPDALLTDPHALAELWAALGVDEEAEPPPRGQDVAGLLGGRVGPELTAWAEALAAPRSPVAGYRPVPPRLTGLHALLEDEGPHRLARLRAVFAALSPVLEHEDELVLASWAPDGRGGSAVWAAHAEDPTPWCEGARLAAVWMEKLVSDEVMSGRGRLSPARREAWQAALAGLGRPAERPGHVEPARLLPRTDWIVALLLPEANLPVRLEAAGTIEAWGREQAVLADWPHLAAYWILHHLVFDNRAALQMAVNLADPGYPANAELIAVGRAYLSGAVPEDGPTAPLFDPQLGLALRARALEAGHFGLFEDETRARLAEASGLAGPAVAPARAALEALVADPEPRVAAALQAWGALAMAAGDVAGFELRLNREWADDADELADGLEGVQRGHGRPLAHLIGVLLGGVDARWRPLFEPHLELGGGFDEAHEANQPGALAGMAALIAAESGFAGLGRWLEDQPLAGGLGRLRRLELALVALRHRGDPDAEAFLRAEAERFVAQLAEPISDTSAVAFDALVADDGPETSRLIGAALAAAPGTGPTAPWLAELGARVRRRPEPAWAAPLLGLLDRGWGRAETGERVVAAEAWARAAGEGAAPEAAARHARAAAGGQDREACVWASAWARVDAAAAEPALGAALDRLLDAERVAPGDVGVASACLLTASELGFAGAVARAARALERADKYARADRLARLRAVVTRGP